MLILLLALCLAVTPAEQRAASALRALAADPNNNIARVDLVTALLRRARETSDPSFLEQAERALKAVPADDFAGGKARAALLIARHEYKAALALAQSLTKRVPDDVAVYGYLTQSYAELGRMKEAEEACQWMLNLRPGNTPAYLMTAYLREKLADPFGAVELYSVALRQTSVDEPEERAWIMVQLARIRKADAPALLKQALETFPHYPLALKAQAALTPGS